MDSCRRYYKHIMNAMAIMKMMLQFKASSITLLGSLFTLQEASLVMFLVQASISIAIKDCNKFLVQATLMRDLKTINCCLSACSMSSLQKAQSPVSA
jgi:hypothetical protein